MNPRSLCFVRWLLIRKNLSRIVYHLLFQWKKITFYWTSVMSSSKSEGKSEAVVVTYPGIYCTKNICSEYFQIALGSADSIRYSLSLLPLIHCMITYCRSQTYQINMLIFYRNYNCNDVLFLTLEKY